MKNLITRNKVMFVGDIHLMDKQPKNRLDDYSVAIRAKLTECLEIAEERKLDAVVHDLDSTSNHEKTALGTLISAGYLIKTDYSPSLGISFAHFYPSLDRDIRAGYLTTSSAIIWVCHASISNKLDRFGEYTFLFEDTPLHPNTSVVISGHIHHEMKQTRSDGKRFINPGAISRYSASRDNLEKDIEVLILDYTLDGEILNEEYLKLKSAKPASEVFKLDEIKAAKDLKQDTLEFKIKVANMRTHSWQFTTLDDKLDALKVMAQQSEIGEEITNIVIDAVRKVNEK